MSGSLHKSIYFLHGFYVFLGYLMRAKATTSSLSRDHRAFVVAPDMAERPA